jgi:hypothetical protein
MNPVHTNNSFTVNWLQSLTLVATEPVARGIKPLLDSVNDLSRAHADSDRMVAARKLWDYAESEDLKNLLTILPVHQPDWLFDADDAFVYRHAADPATASTDFAAALSFETWTQWLGLAPWEASLAADVTSNDWLSLVRQEAVRQQRAMNAAAVPTGKNLTLPATASWDGNAWSIRFEAADWLVRRYEEAFTVQRPEMTDIAERIDWTILSAHDRLVPPHPPKISDQFQPPAWLNCVPDLKPLHERILLAETKPFATWFRRVWHAVWPVIYREQNVLGGKADLDFLRRELAECVKHAPRLTVWTFVSAKLICNTLLGSGLGIAGDYAR